MSSKKHTGRTIYTGLLGYPVNHSLLPLIFNYLYKKYEIPYAYECFNVHKDEFPSVFDELRLLDFKGFQVTSPGKTAAAYLCDKLSGSAVLSNTVDTVVMKGRAMIGHNTRGHAFVTAVEKTGIKIKGSSITVFGCEEDAFSVITKAALKGAAAIYIGAPKEYDELTQLVHLLFALSKKTKCRFNVFNTNDINLTETALSNSTIMVNAASVGTYPDTDGCVISDPYLLRSNLTVADMVYYPRDTKLLQYASAFGCNIVEGVDILLYQAADAFKLFTGLKVPEEDLQSLYPALYQQTLYTAQLQE